MKAGTADQKTAMFCGIIMPIAPMPDYESGHWPRVREVLDRAIENAGFKPRLVSESEDIGVIHGHIVQNLYDDDIVVCDVSGKNANVMFELGLRLAFDKPTIIVKDDITGYSFDTSPIKHIGYRKDQRFDDVAQFQKELTAAILSTIEAKKNDESYSPFLKHFGKFTPKSIDNKEIPQIDYILNKLSSIEAAMVSNVTLEHFRPKITLSSENAPRVSPHDQSIKDAIYRSLEANINKMGDAYSVDEEAAKRQALVLLEREGRAVPKSFFDRMWTRELVRFVNNLPGDD